MSKHVSLTDLSAELLMQVADFLAPPRWTLGVHWLNGTQPVLSNADLRAFRSTCRHTRAAIRPHDLTVRIKGNLNTHRELRRWLDAPASVLERVKHITLQPPDRRQDLPIPLVAQSLFDDCNTLLSRCPNLITLEIAHSPFCVHDLYGLGRHRAFSLTLPHILTLPISILSVSLKCRVCAMALTRILASCCTLKCLRASVMSFDPPSLALFPLVHHLGALRTLHLKVPDDWNLTAILYDLEPCTELKELHIAPYDASRKVAVVDKLGRLGNSEPLAYTSPVIAGDLYDSRVPRTGIIGQGMGVGIDEFLVALGAFDLEELDLCISPAALDRSLVDMEHCPLWVEGATKASEMLVMACPTLRRGWWWIQVVDLDYRQLRGYERWSWVVDDGEVRLENEPRHLAPLVVRNQDGQGTSVDMPSEEWS